MGSRDDLTPEEIEALRQLLVRAARTAWLASAAAALSRWLTVVIGAWLAIKGVIPWVK